MASLRAEDKVKIKHKIWLERNGKVIFGQGRSILLRAIDECGSLNSAAKKLNMSYRAAWGRLKASEERLGIKLMEVDASNGRMKMTDDAKELLRKFDELERETEAFVEFAYQKLAFPVEKRREIKAC
jgi:molybdate transport system regulatory protein